MFLIRFTDKLEPMIDLKHVKTFLAIQQKGSFSAAADHLDIAQPTVSLHMRSLEKALGYALFDRMGRQAIMTQEGIQFLPKAIDLLRLAEESRSINGDTAALSGALRLCIVQSICTYKMPPFLQQYQRKHPAVQVQITVSRPSTYMLQQLRNGDFDAVIVLEAPFEIPSLVSKKLWSDQLQLIAHPAHHLVKKTAVKLSSLAQEPFIFPESSAHYRRLFERRLQEQAITPQIALEVDNMEAIKRCVMAGMGLAVIPRYAIEQEVADGRLIPLELEGRKLSVTAQLIWHKEKFMSKPTQAFIDMMVQSNYQLKKT